MKNHNLSSIAVVVMMTSMLLLAGGLACVADSAPLTPEYAAKKENFRKQHEQRISPEKRKAAAEALKSKRLEVYKAKQAKRASQAQPEKLDTK